MIDPLMQLAFNLHEDKDVYALPLDILHSFRSILEDTTADEGIVLTSNGVRK